MEYMGKVIGVVSLKGGVGKTSSVVSLGASLANLGKSVLLIDGNLSAPNLGMHLDLVNPENTLHNVLNDEIQISDAIYKSHGFDVIPSSVFNPGEMSPLKLKSKIKNLKDKYDVILIDSSPSLNDETLAVILASDEVLVVTTPDFSTLSMTLKAANLAKKRGTPITGLILNKVYKKNFELSLDDIEKTSSIPVMAVVPHDVHVMKSQANFVPSVHFKPRSHGTHEYMKLASLLVGEKYKPSNIYEFFSRVSPSRQEINREIYYESLF